MYNNATSMIRENLLRQNYHAPATSDKLYLPTFDFKSLQTVIGLIQDPGIAAAMKECNPHAPVEDIIKGEIGRLMMLSGAFHPDFYHQSIGRLIACGVIKPGYSMMELGSSFCAHIPQMPKELQPGSMKGIDSNPLVVAAAEASVAEFEQAGLINAGKITVIKGDHEYMDGVGGDISITSLFSQYDSGPDGAINWHIGHGTKANINGDVVHSPFEISDTDLSSKILPFKCSRLPYYGGYTGVNLSLHGDPVETPFGKVYSTSMLLDSEVYDHKNGIIQIAQPGAELEGKVTIFERDGKTYAEPWAWELTEEATADDIRNLSAIRHTFNEQYSLLKEVTSNPVREWESIAALAVPVLAARKGLYSVVAFNTATQAAERSGMLPMAMLRRNGEEVRKIHEAGLFTHVGEGKTFENLDELYKVVGAYLADAPRFFRAVKYTNPLLVTSTTTANKEIFEKLQTV